MILEPKKIKFVLKSTVGQLQAVRLWDSDPPRSSSSCGGLVTKLCQTLVTPGKVVVESHKDSGILGPRRRRIQSGARDEA